MPTLNIRFLHALCNDVDAIRAFYTDRLWVDGQGSYGAHGGAVLYAGGVRAAGEEPVWAGQGQ